MQELSDCLKYRTSGIYTTEYANSIRNQMTLICIDNKNTSIKETMKTRTISQVSDILEHLFLMMLKIWMKK